MSLFEFSEFRTRWNINLKQCSNLIFSPSFKFQGSACYLRVIQHSSTIIVTLTDTNMDGFWGFKPLKLCTAVVSLEDTVSGQILLVLSETTKVCTIPTDIWRRTKKDIELVIPQFRTNHQLTFVIEFKEDVDDHQAGYKSISTPSISVQDMENFLCVQSLSEDLAKILDEGSDTDVEFHHDDHCTKAHKAIVCARSPVLARMLHNDMSEAKTGVVKIPDMEPDIIKRFFRYLYTWRLDELTFDVAMSLYEAGDKYEVRGLVRKCSNFLMEHLTVENACDVLVVADAHSDAVFVDKVIDYMMESKVPVMSNRWSDFCDGHPKLANKVLNSVCKVVWGRQIEEDCEEID